MVLATPSSACPIGSTLQKPTGQAYNLAGQLVLDIIAPCSSVSARLHPALEPVRRPWRLLSDPAPFVNVYWVLFFLGDNQKGWLSLWSPFKTAHKGADPPKTKDPEVWGAHIPTPHRHGLGPGLVQDLRRDPGERSRQLEARLQGAETRSQSERRGPASCPENRFFFWLGGFP